MNICVKQGLLVIMLLGPVANWAPAQKILDVPNSYQRFFYYYGDQRKLYEKMLNYPGFTSQPVGRSIVLIAGVIQDANLLGERDRTLKPAAVDIEILKSYLKDPEFFDEITVIKDADVNLENVDYFLGTYLPKRFTRAVPVAKSTFGMEPSSHTCKRLAASLAKSSN